MSLAFFDIDGTLLAKPSLERRFFHELRGQEKIPAANYFVWLAEIGRRASGHFWAAIHANKMYLRGVSAEAPFVVGKNRGDAWLPEFFPAAMQRVWWHVLRGDSIVLVSGTLAPLADMVKFALERELLWRGVQGRVSVLATQMEVFDGRWTGRVLGAPMFGEAKARALSDFAKARQIALLKCSAYGDSWLDRWMLAAVGRPFAINPARRLQRLARLRGWPTLRWTHGPVRRAGQQRETKNVAKRDCRWTALRKKDLAAR